MEDLIFCSGVNQVPKVLEVIANSWKAVVLSALISDRNPNHKVEGISRPYGISLYCLTR
jgi:hypothetical protein